MPIDYFAVCDQHRLVGPPVWRQLPEAGLRWFLVEHVGCGVRVVSEHGRELDDYERWADDRSDAE